MNNDKLSMIIFTRIPNSKILLLLPAKSTRYPCTYGCSHIDKYIYSFPFT